MKVKIRAGTEGRGKITVRGDFLLLEGEVFNPATVAMRVVDSTELDVLAPGPLCEEDADCGTLGVCVANLCTAGDAMEPPATCTQSGRTIRCSQPGHRTGVQTVASFVISSTNPMTVRTVKANLKVRRLSLKGTSFYEPISVTLSDGSLHRWGDIHDCAPRQGTLRCREF